MERIPHRLGYIPQDNLIKIIRKTACCLLVILFIPYFLSPTNGQSEQLLEEPRLPVDLADTPTPKNGFRLPALRQFFIASSRLVRPDQTYKVFITIFQMTTTNVTVQAILTRDEVEYGTGLTVFSEPSTKEILIKVPPGTQPGEHKLTVIGLTGGQQGFPIFRNETYLDFDTKYMSIFVQTDKPVYYPPQPIIFRIIGVRPDLAAMEGGMTIYIQDARDIIVRRYLMRQLKFGFYRNTFELTYPVNVGTWKIVVDAFGHMYEHPFEVMWYWGRRFETNISAPLYIFDTDRNFQASVYGEHQTSKYSHGNASIQLRCRDEDGEILPGAIFRELGWMTQTHFIDFRVADLEEMWGELGGKTILFEGWLNDWEFEETQNGSFVMPVYRDLTSVKRLGGYYASFHPGKPFTVYFAIVMGDGSMYTRSENRTVYVDEIHENGQDRFEQVVIPDDSIVKWTVTPDDDDTMITIRARYPQSAKQDEVIAFRYFSRKGRYIMLSTSTHQPTTNEYMVCTVRANFFATRLNYLVVANGELLISTSMDMYSYQKTFSLALSRQMMPRARIIVYSIIEDEVIMDSMNFFIKDSQLTNASITLNRGKDFKRDVIELIGKDRIGSFMLTVGQDWEWAYRGAGTHLIPRKVIRDLFEYDDPNQPPHHHIWYHNDIRWEEDVYFNSDTIGLDPFSTLWSSGVAVITDLRVSHAHLEERTCNISLGLGQCISGMCFDIYTQKCDGQYDCPDGYDEAGCPLADQFKPKPRAPYIENLAYFGRYYADVAWMMQETYLKPNLGGQVELALEVPEDTNPYVMHAVFLHPEFGLSLADDYIMYDTTRLFFIYCEAPPVIKRGEQVGIRCAIYNTWEQDLEILMTLHGGDDYRFINVEDFGIVSSYNPRTTAGDVHTMVSIWPGETRYFYMPMIPVIESGSFVVSISASSIIDRDLDELEFEVIYDGIQNGDIIPYLADLFYQGSLWTPYFEIPIPEQFYIPGQRDLLYIPGSNVASVHVFGDVVAPGFYEDYFTLDGAVSLPHDSAEGYMFDFAINLVLLQYLEAVDSLEADAQNKALDFMISTLMRQYAYLQEDGSFKMFRRTEKPSVLVTSFILNYLHKMYVTEWVEEVYIPSTMINKIALWLSKQQILTGAFVETADFYYNRNFYPNSTDEHGVNHTWHIPLTAHCVITLASATRLTGEAKASAAEAVGRGITYLAGLVPYITDPFQMAITAFALYTADHGSRDDAYFKLKTMKREDRNVYWCHTEIPPNEIRIVDTKHLMQARGKYPTLSNGVMATSYAMMLYLLKGEFEESRPIMKWLNDQRADMINWIGIPDTLLAIEALTEYAKRETNHAFYNMEIIIEATSSPGWREVVKINQSTFPALFEFEVPVAWGEVATYTSGTGFAFIGVTSALNVEKGYLVDNPSYSSFDYYMKDVKWYGRNASKVEFNPCVRWVRPDIHYESGMAVYSQGIPTGYVVDRDEIERLYLLKLPYLQRVRFRDNTLYMFWEKITQQEMCFTVLARRWYPVANTSVSHIYGFMEYSEPFMYLNDAYSTYTLFHLHICQVCGSFQCPYCTWYNTSPVHKASVLYLVIWMLFGWFLKYLSWQ